MMFYSIDTLRVTYRISLGNNQTGKTIDSNELPEGADYDTLKLNWRTENLNSTQSLNFLDLKGFSSKLVFTCDEALKGIEN